MKKLIYTLAFIFVSNLVLAQTTTENYVKTTSYQVKTTDGTTNAETSAPLQNDDKSESVTYIDGMGRPIQSVSKQGGGNKQDIIVPVVYDELGRQVLEYLPYANSSQAFGSATLGIRNQAILLNDIESYYATKYPEDAITTTTINAFSQKRFETSPLNRVLEQGAPGKDWRVIDTLDTDHTIKFEYHTNTFDSINPTNANNDNVYLFDVQFSGNPDNPSLVYSGHYNQGELYKTITKDENWTSGKDHTTEEFKNKLGQVVLKRTYDNSISHDTYYIYDDFGNLTFVLSPEGSKKILNGTSIKQTVLDDFCYQYNYDYRNRLIEKKIPQKGWEYIVYDNLDRPVLTQDANLRLNNDWLFTKYDKLDRVTYTGIMNTTVSRDSLQSLISSLTVQSETRVSIPETIDGTNVYYNNLAYPIVNISKLLTINYYDDYNWDKDNNFEASYNLTNVSSGLSQVGNTITKVSSSSWNQGFKSEATISGDGYIQWTAKTSNTELVIGLSNINSAPDNHYNTIDYGIYLKNNGTVRIYEEGINQPIPTAYYSVDDVFRVERTLGQITYYKNGIAFHASITTSTGSLIGDSSFYSNTAKVEDVFVGYSSLGQPFTQNTKGLATGGKVRVLDTNAWISSSTYYDNKARAIYSISENGHLKNVDAISSYFDFTGKVIRSHSTHSAKSTIVTIDDYRYDHTGRLLRQEQKVNNEDKQLIVKNNYDELGQLEQKQVGGSLPKLSNYVNRVGVTISNNLLSKNNTGPWGHSGLSTAETISGDGYVSFSGMNSGNLGTFACGLSYTDPNQHWNSIKYAIYIQATGLVSVRESGVNRGIKTTHVPGDIFAVERRGITIYYLKNGEPFYVSEVEATTAPMVGDLALYNLAATVKDLVVVDLETELQEVDYTYNIRGWLKTINDVDNYNVSGVNDDLFAFKINYNTNDLDGTPLYNGNISETLWNTLSVDPNNQESKKKRGYDYTYDALNRIESADFHKILGVDHNDYYNLSGVSYDRNGNILTLARSGVNSSGSLLTTMDDLIYKYKGNQLDDVFESGNSEYGFKDAGASAPGSDFKYDANGNMTDDFNKDIVITYNHLNLPVTVTESGENTITYTYDATGVKLSKSVTEGSNTTVTDYANSFVYKDGKLQFFPHPEGYIDGDLEYVYQYKDHLGNIRLSYKDANDNGVIETTEIVEENNYYPFGLKHKGYNNVVTSTNPAQKFKYNGKELEQGLGLDWYDYGARNYDASIGRWMNLDPLAEIYHTDTPYAYVLNNPLSYIDPDGRQVVGTKREDADKIHEDLNTVFADAKFDALRSLFTRGRRNNRKGFDKIDGDAFNEAISGLENEDDILLAEMIVGAINSEDVHEVEYVEDGNDPLSENAMSNITIKSEVKSYYDGLGKAPPSFILGGSQTAKTADGSYTLMIESDQSPADYYDSTTGQYVSNPGGRANLSLHEVIGHGRSLTSGRGGNIAQHLDAIKTENLVLRVMGKGNVQRDGTDHGTKQKINDSSSKPGFK